MLRLASSTYSSICCIVFLNFLWLLLLTTTSAKPTNSSDSYPKNEMQHVTSFVNQKPKSGVRSEFDFEQNEAEATNSAHLQQLFSSLLQLPGNVSLQLSVETDDEPVSERNMLDDMEIAGEQHEGFTESSDEWHRIKLAIPVLEPVKHLINAVGGGGVNDSHVKSNTHRLIGHHGVHETHHPGGNISSPAIETEEDRETAIDSTSFDLLETLGTAGTVLIGILQNLRKLFAASAGNASSASSGGGGGGK
ncbi:uncharacterized protein LOC119560483 [Drosophila subpulchrella]|uniref:uncharacterized protein LOC119560483 n=1 Tax=Drosophila subpulchrella TaxID=1486046 RepID=UPI0018A19C67|nr:uncharacterized protein LOC119560483 [Drosophila subpulchrella]